MLYLKHLRRNVDDVAFGPAVVARIHQADAFIGELERDINQPSSNASYLHIVSKFVVTALNRLQDDARVCLELRLQVQEHGAPLHRDCRCREPYPKPIDPLALVTRGR